MTEVEITKAAECCKNEDCLNCPLNIYVYQLKCKNILFEAVNDLVNSKNAEIKMLKEAGDTECEAYACDLLDQRDKAKAEVEELKEIIGAFPKVNIQDCNFVRDEAIKEFAERVKNDYEWFSKEIDQIAKEMGVEL